jgi:hypothetical protein
MKETVLTKKDLSLIEDNLLNDKQMQVLLSRTPDVYIKERPAKGGGTWKYVSGAYVRKCLNLMFGFNWDFEILDEKIIHDEAIVKGRLICRIGDKTIIKTQFGNKEIIYQNEWIKDENGKSIKVKSDKPLSIGNDLKSAATDALKKCASELGIASDVYNADDFEPVRIETLTEDDLLFLFEQVKDKMEDKHIIAMDRIITNKEVHSYKRAFDFMNTLITNK